MFNRGLAESLSSLNGRLVVDAYFGDISLACYEKVFEILCRRIECDGSDERFVSALWTDAYNDPDGYPWGREDGYWRAIELYLYNDSYFDTVLERFASVLDGKVTSVGPLHDHELQQTYDELDRNRADAAALREQFTEQVKARACELAGLDDAFYAAIPHLDEMFMDCLLQGINDEGEWGFYALSSKKLGAFLTWKGKRKRKSKRLKRVMDLYEAVTTPFAPSYCHRHVEDGVFYAVIFTGFDAFSQMPVAACDMWPSFLADLYLLNEEIDALNKKYNFYRKEEGYAAVSDRAA